MAECIAVEEVVAHAGEVGHSGEDVDEGISVSGAGRTFAWVFASMIQAWSLLSPLRYDGSM